jgi:hypothetical protein
VIVKAKKFVSRRGAEEKEKRREVKKSAKQKFD